MATFICKPVKLCAPIPLIFNNVNIHNPQNIDASNICFRLLHQYSGIFDISYRTRRLQWIASGDLKFDFNKIKLLTVHAYDDAINERKEERSTKNIRLIGFQEQGLHSIYDYINALQMILKINKDTQHLDNHVAPIVADWPG